NIASGNATAEDTFRQWVTSPTHNTNMLATDVTHAGVGRAFNAGSTYRWYWTLDLVRPAVTPASSTSTTAGPTTTSPATSTSSTTSTVPTPTTTVVTTATTITPGAGPTTTTPASTTTTVPSLAAAGGLCAGLEAMKVEIDNELAALQQAVAGVLGQPEALFAPLEELRLATAAEIDVARSAAGCPAPAFAEFDVVTAATAS
ncbi:MAG: CAP domain-containing protein, partial [Actinomycetota bacterium]|nr:CAP domain-containing protein [Actinomycetota bacterium]